ncbi:MAG: tetratricopeptide repeat protein [Elusimicrobiaceae bacterium]|nr:tetratricopeptide repeat protein [Elusimicrobiaceae bacterium]
MRLLTFVLIFSALAMPARADTAQEYYDRALANEIPTKRVKLLGKAINEDAAFAPAYFLRAQAVMDLNDCDAALPDLDKTVALGYAPVQARYYRGSCLLELGRSTAAIADYSAVISSAPDSPSAYYRRAVAYIALNDVTGAMSDLDRTLSLDPGYLPAYPRRARLNYRIGKYEAAAADCTAAIKAGFDKQLLTERGNSYLALGQFDSAAQDYNAILAGQPKNYPALAGLAQAYIGLKNATAAVAASDGVIAAYPADKTGYLLLARSYELNADTASAAAVYSSMTGQFPAAPEPWLGLAELNFASGDAVAAVSNSSAAIALSNALPQAYYLRGKALLQLGDQDGARRDLLEAGKLRPADIMIKLLLARIYFSGPDTQAGLDETLAALKLDYAATLAELGAAESSGVICGLNLALGAFEMDRRDTARAKTCFDKAIAAAPDFWMGYSFRSQLLRMTRKFSPALADINKAVRLDGGNWQLYLERGKLYYELRQNDKAYRDFTQAARLKPDYAEIYNYTGRMFLRVKMYGKAEEEFTKALSLFASADVYANRALARLRQNNPEGAREDLESALKLNPDDPKTYIGLACYYWSAGNDRAKALSNLEQAFKAGFTRYNLLTHASGYGNYLSGIDSDPDYVALLEKYSSPAQAQALSADYE